MTADEVTRRLEVLGDLIAVMHSAVGFVDWKEALRHATMYADEIEATLRHHGESFSCDCECESEPQLLEEGN